MSIPTVRLPGTSLATTAIGFGCNALLGPRSRREGLNLLAAAYDAGIRHFDVARAYSSGDAEGLLGEFLSDGDRRAKVTITTKFGLQPPSSGLGRMKLVKNVARKLMKLSPRLRKAIGARSGKMVEQGAFSPEQARASLETSLRELRTDRVEIFLMHEGSVADCTPGLREFLVEQQGKNRIGWFGVGAQFDRVHQVAVDRPEFAGILQFESSVRRRNRESLAPSNSTATITHGAIGGSFTELRALFAKHPDLAKQWSEELAIDVSNPAVLAPLMLSFAVRDNPTGLVLFSSTRPAAIAENVRAVVDGKFAPEQIDRFAQLVRESQSPGQAF